MAKTKIAIFDLTGCEGCEFQILSLDEMLLDLFQDFEITHWRLLSEDQKADFDIALIEGAVTTKEHIKLLKQIRKTSKIVVAIGACAISGNIFAQLKTPAQRKKVAQKIYTKDYKLKAEFLEPVEKFIKIDAMVPGCPPNMEIFKKLLEKFKEQKIISKKKKVSPPDYTAKIEGHGTLRINFKKRRAEFEVEEGERLVEGLLWGKNFNLAPQNTSRICGICPIAHNLCSLAAIENALKLKISEETIILRKILLASQMIKSHLLHLFFLVLPDYAGLKGSIELAKKYPAEFHLMLNLKRTADEILKTVGGSSAFPTNTAVGGFRTPPDRNKLLSAKSSVFEVIDEAQDLIKLFSVLKIPELKSGAKFITIKPENGYPYYPGLSTQTIKEIVKKDSPVKLGVLKNGEVVKGGALARLSGFSANLNNKAKKAFTGLNLNFKNPFNNNLAQAIEILHFLEEIINLIEKITNKDINKTKAPAVINLRQNNVKGEACLEAPRGILFHQIEINKEGRIVNYNIIPPTQINLASLKKEAQQLIKQNKEVSEENIEKLIRAFDPCITCAVH